MPEMKGTITAQEIMDNFPESVKAKLRAKWPTKHHARYPETPGDPIVCFRDGVDLTNAIENGLSLDGCLPDLTMPRLLRIAEARGYRSEALDAMKTGELIDQLWLKIKAKEGI